MANYFKYFLFSLFTFQFWYPLVRRVVKQVICLGNGKWQETTTSI